MPLNISYLNLKETLDNIEISILDDYLSKCGGNKSLAAKYLQIQRTTLIARLHSLGLKNWLKIDARRKPKLN